MEPSSPSGIIVITASLLFTAWLIRGFVAAFGNAKTGLIDIGNAFLIHVERMERVKKMFYLRAWTAEEAEYAIGELRRQLDLRLNLCRTPEFKALGQSTTHSMLALAVFTKVLLSTEEIRSRIAFLERILARKRDVHVAISA